MAKNTGRLAGLAALAGAAYLMNKDKDKGTTDSNPTRGAGYQSTETREEPRRKIEDYQAKAPLMDEQKYSSGVMGGARMADAVKPAPAPAVNAVTSTPPAQVDRTMEDSTKQNVLNALNQQAGANTPSALRSDQLANVSRAVKREQKTKQFAQDVPYQESAAKTDAMMVASRAARKADALKRSAKTSAFKSGGAVKKMASGGMTASKRADGIASKGKTRCKMY